MASKSILRSSVKSPGARALMLPMSSKSILKRPAPLPLSPSSPFPVMASFSVLVSPNKLAPHVHFPASPAMVATFSAFSPNTYDRQSIPVSPSPADLSPWAGRIISPSIKGFQLANPPPKRASAKVDSLLAPPTFEDPRSPKPYSARSRPAKEQIVPAKEQTIAVVSRDTLAPPPPFEDPRSPKPYRSRSGVRFEELVLHVPRGNVAVEDLGKALALYPRSPYPSARLANEEDVSGMSGLVSPRGRANVRPSKLKKPTHTRARSLDTKSKRRQTLALGSANPVDFLSPVQETPGLAHSSSKPTPLDLESESHLTNAFWQAVTLEAETPASAVAGNAFKSPQNIMFGNQDGSLWSPRPRKREHRGLTEVASMMSPAQRNVFRKGAVASPSPNDPFAAFPSFTVSLMNMEGVISYPPRARVEQ